MKNALQFIAILLLASFGFTSVNAQVVKFHAKEPPVITHEYIQTAIGTDNTIYNTDFKLTGSGTVYGCGDASSITAEFAAKGNATTTCNNGGSDPGPVPGQSNIDLKSDPKSFDATNGHAYFSLEATFSGSCQGGGKDWFHTVSAVSLSELTITINGVTIDLTKYL